MLTVTSLYKSYVDGSRAVEVLRGLDFTLAAGESLAITGASGSGKSTVLNILAGLLSVDQGGVEWVDEQAVSHPLHSMSAAQRAAFRRRHVGYVHQFFNLIPTLTVYENVLLPLRLNRLKGQDQRVDELLATIGLEHRRDAFPEVLSGGEQQRVAVARALVAGPGLVLADEPTGNLDRDNSQRVAELLFTTAAACNATLLVATHSETVAAMAGRRLQLEA